jgi:hypothetical protein
MNPRTRKFLGVALLLAVLLALLWDLIPLRDAQARVALMPSSGLGFTSLNVPLNETEKSIFGPALVTKRVYRVSRKNFLVVIIDGARNRHAVHDPTYCFHGAGWTLQGGRDMTVPGGTAKIVFMQKGMEVRSAAFWFSDGQTRHGNIMRCWWQMACRRLTFGASGAESVLVLVQPLDDGEAVWGLLSAQLGFLFDL